MSRTVGIGFEPESRLVDIDAILPTKKIQPRVKFTRKYLQITASISEIGIVEPPIVTPAGSKTDKYLLLDGHLRIEALKDLEINNVMCLLSLDDEAFTYNKRINRLATIQEHRMILKAIERGVPQERIAKVLDVNVSTIRQKRRLLEGICPEAAELLKDKKCPINTFESLRKMKPLRQIEVAELMISMNNYSVSYSRAILAATPQDQLAEPKKQKSFKGVSPEQLEKMEVEMAQLQREIKLVEDSYGPNHLNVVLARGYLVTLLDNGKVARYLDRHHQAITLEFKKIAATDALGSE